MKHFRWIDSKPSFGEDFSYIFGEDSKKLKQILTKNHWKTICMQRNSISMIHYSLLVSFVFFAFFLSVISNLLGCANKIPTGLEKVGLDMPCFKVFPWILWRNKINFTQMMRENIIIPNTVVPWHMAPPMGFMRFLFTMEQLPSPQLVDELEAKPQYGLENLPGYPACSISTWILWDYI